MKITADNQRHYQSEQTTLVWGCGHTVAVYLAINPIVAAEQVAAYIQIDCLTCAKAKKAQTRGILWADLKGSRS